MPLPPKQQNDLEWDQIQRRSNNSAWASMFAMGLGSVPYAIVESIASAPRFGRLAFSVFLFAAFLTMTAAVCFRRFNRGSFQRAFAAGSVFIHGAVALSVLAILLQRD